MVATSTSPYITKDGQERRYSVYSCPSCKNMPEGSPRVSEEWLRGEVLRDSLTVLCRDGSLRLLRGDFSMASAERSWSHAFLEDLIPQVRAALHALEGNRVDGRPALEAERRELEDRICGFRMSLGKPDLPGSVRAEIEQEFATVLERRDLVAEAAVAEESRLRATKMTISNDEIIERLNRLDDILAKGDPTRMNLELSLHIDRITCYRNGRVSDAPLQVRSDARRAKTPCRRGQLHGRHARASRAAPRSLTSSRR